MEALPANWNRIDPKTGVPVGIDRGRAYAPGAPVAETITALSKRLETLPERPSVDLIQSGLRMDAFADWMRKPQGDWPMARISAAHAEELGSKASVAMMSPATAAKQEREYPKLMGLDHLMAQRAIDLATHRIRDTGQSMIYVLVVKVTKSGKGLFVQSFRRISADARERDQELGRLMWKLDRRR